MNKLSSINNSKIPAPTEPANTMATDALIVNSNSTTVSDEIILQLQEQFGSSKQIYILNSSTNSLISSSTLISNQTISYNQPVQYLVIDKDVDINLILQDPTIFNQQHHQPQEKQVQPPQQQTARLSQQQQQSNLIEESVLRVQAPPPKRKKLEFVFENKKNSYQDVFLRYLSGEKQPTLENIVSINPNENLNNKKPKDNIFYAARTTNSTNETSTVASLQSIQPTTTNALNNDKENYYNSSRRENLMPLNNYEYRNSYKDHYDNQGVRLNPAILKNLPPGTTTTTSATSSTSPTNSHLTQVKPNNSNNKSSIVVTKSCNKVNTKQSVQSNSLLDHTYKMHDSKVKFVEQQEHSNIVNQDNLNNVKAAETITAAATASNANNQEEIVLIDEVEFNVGDFLIHKSTFSGDFENYDIWCVINEVYLQKYEPVLLSTGERCHQSADILAEYMQEKSEFLLVKVEEKGKTEQENIVVGVLSEYEPKNNKSYSKILQQSISDFKTNNETMLKNASPATMTTQSVSSSIANPLLSTLSNSTQLTSSSQQVFLVTDDYLKRTFDVLLQSLLSQYLNSEFLIKIKEINDEYFKPALDLIDTILNEKYDLIINHLNQFIEGLPVPTSTTKSVNYKFKLNPLYKFLLENKPKMLVTSNINISSSNKKCDSLICYHENEASLTTTLLAQHLIKFHGRSYNMDSLQYFDQVNNDEDHDTLSLLNQFYNNNAGLNNHNENKPMAEFYICTKILNITQMLHALKHFKINFYESCSQKIESIKNETTKTEMQQTTNALIGSNSKSQSNSLDENNTNNTELLNHCLADSKWLLQMFEKFKQLLFDVDTLLNSKEDVITTATSNAANTNGSNNNNDSMDVDIVNLDVNLVNSNNEINNYNDSKLLAKEETINANKKAHH